MNNPSVFTNETTSRRKAIPVEKDEYYSILEKHQIQHKTDAYYIYSGTPKLTQGWLLHITVIPAQISDLLNEILPVLIKYKIPFKLVRNKKIHIDMNAGVYGNYKIGKAITLFLDEDSIILPLLNELVTITNVYSGPEIYTDFILSKAIYTRYGSFVNEIAIDRLENRVVLIRDISGNISIDRYTIPSSIPEGFHNPFLPFLANLPKPQKEHLIGQKYMPLKLLKRDAKGDVWKAIYFNKYLFPKWCVIKQGRVGMYPDDHGRDATNRIEWQAKIHQDVYDLIAIPRLIDYFKHEEQAYLVIEYIKGGKDLIKMVFAKFKNAPWFSQPLNIKQDVINYLTTIVSSIETLHQNGFIHRDITGTNFLLDKKNKIKIIDLELVYSTNEKKPNPPFGVGTEGFMSPEQSNRKTPTVHDDAYSIGSLIMMILTEGLYPKYLIEEDLTHLQSKLDFFIREKALTDIILSCLSKEPEKRPSVKQINEKLKSYKTDVQITVNDDPPRKELEQTSILDTISQSIQSLAGDLMTTDGLWTSNIENQYGPEVYPLGKKTIFSGLYRGIGGVIWGLSKLSRFNFDVSSVNKNIEQGFHHIYSQTIPSLNNLSPSYYYGRAGIAVMLTEVLNSKIVPSNNRLEEIIEKCFTPQFDSIDLTYGLAGQGLALMHCESQMDKSHFTKLMDEYVSTLLQLQEKDGTWVMQDQHGRKEKKNGLAYGMAGISYFLAEYGARFNHKKALDSAEKAASYLIKSVHRTKTKAEWTTSNINKEVSTWWCQGAPGISLLYLKLYSITNKQKYLDMVSECLSKIPEKLIYQNLSQCHGISGLGEIYLEAYRVTNSKIWYDRATWLANSIKHLARHDNPGELYWIAETKDTPTADLMVGNTGIIHFLARYSLPNDIGFPLLVNN